MGGRWRRTVEENGGGEVMQCDEMMEGKEFFPGHSWTNHRPGQEPAGGTFSLDGEEEQRGEEFPVIHEN